MPGIGQIGYVANSHYTVIGECFSAGRLYDKIGDEAKGTVLYVLPNGAVCQLEARGGDRRTPIEELEKNGLPGSIDD